MTDQDWLTAYTKGATDAKADVVEWLLLLASTGHKLVDTRGIAGRIERGEHER